MKLKDRYEAYEKANTITHYADAETAERLHCKVGDEYTTFPPPATKEKAWEKLKEYTSLIHLESLIKAFKTNFPINLRTLNDELAELQKFIDESETYSTVDAFKSKDEFFRQRHYNYEYLKLKYGYYDNAEYKAYHFFTAYTEHVFGKYFVYKNWLEEQKRELKPKPPKFNHHQLEYDVTRRLEAELEITVFEKIKRELNAYHKIYISQFSKKSTQLEFPMIHSDGRYCPSIEIHTNSEIGKIEKYKNYYTKRFEKGKRKTAVENELLEIYKKAVVVRNYFNENLTNANPIVAATAEEFGKDFTNRERFHMHVVIDQYNLMDVYFNQDTNQGFINSSRREFNYPVFNRTFAEFCQNLIDFIDNFEIDKIMKLEANPEFKALSDNPAKVAKNLHNNIFKFNAFEVFEEYKKKKSISVQSRTDLRVIFELLKADSLLVETVELKHYIKWLNEIYFNNNLGSELKFQDLKTKNNIQRTIDYNDIKKLTLKQP